MIRRAWLLPIVVVALAGAAMVGLRSRSSSSSDRQTSTTGAVPQAAAATPAKAPRVVGADEEFDFGVMEIGDQGSHEFVVRNDGDADLTLELGSSTCKCTLASLGQAIVAPGEETKIKLEWHIDEYQPHFRQGVRIRTNDPQTPAFGLGILGRVCQQMQVEPLLAYFREVPRRSSATLDFTLYSQVFEDVKIEKVESTHPDVTVELLPSTDKLRPELNSLFTRRLLLHYQADNQPGAFHGTIRVHFSASAPGVKQLRSPFEFHFTGEKVGDITMHGRALTGKVLNFGPVSGARGAVEKAYLHIRGQGDAAVELIEAAPAFLQVRVLPAQRLSETMIRFPIEVTVPKGTPEASTSAGNLGEIRLRTTHPDHPQIRFQVGYVIGP